MRALKWAALGLAMVFLSACGTITPPPYSGDYAALDKMKAVGLKKASVAQFQPTDPSHPVNTISLRAPSMKDPSGAFATYLRAALIQDLREISAYDETSSTRIDATILKNVIDISSMTTGKGDMEVELSVSRAGAVLLKKKYAAHIEFESAFAGMVAVPKGQLEYGRLVRTLLGQVYADADFVNALKQ